MKPIRYIITSLLKSLISEEYQTRLTNAIQSIYLKEQYDMYVIEPNEENEELVNIKIAGYHLETGELEEERIAGTIKAPANSPVIWVKFDDYGDYDVCTLLLPSEW
ncbi:MAG TPA: hypothetical protein PK816_03715 [Candidatus Cloacimonadota bacterium]|nr:hypothetical protein [Candidatus Cloacimonadota bacterium]